MLQAVPDPFDCYGPPTTEDQIFSILPPLMTTSPGPNSMVSTPQLNPRDLGISPTRPSWMPTVAQIGAGAYFTEANSAGADAPSPVASPPKSPPQRRSKSPQRERGAFGFFRSSQPPASGGGAKAESKLRSVLTAVDESHVRPRNGSNDSSEKDADSPDTPTNPGMSGGINGLTRSASDKLGQTPGDGGGSVGSWNRGSLDTDNESEGGASPTTPRHSVVLLPTSTDPPSPTLKGHDREASRTPTAEHVELPT